MSRVLIVDDDPAFARALARGLERAGYDTAVALDAEAALSALEETFFQQACVDLRLGSESGLDLLDGLQKRQPDLVVVILTGYASIATAVEATRRGARDYRAKPVGVTEVVAALEGDNGPAEIPDEPLSLPRLKWEHIQQVLRDHDNNVSAAARTLGVHRRSLQRMLEKNPPGE
jgi:two-component system response regulator RegA